MLVTTVVTRVKWSHFEISASLGEVTVFSSLKPARLGTSLSHIVRNRVHSSFIWTDPHFLTQSLLQLHNMSPPSSCQCKSAAKTSCINILLTVIWIKTTNWLKRMRFDWFANPQRKRLLILIKPFYHLPSMRILPPRLLLLWNSSMIMSRYSWKRSIQVHGIWGRM